MYSIYFFSSFIINPHHIHFSFVFVINLWGKIIFHSQQDCTVCTRQLLQRRSQPRATGNDISSPSLPAPSYVVISSCDGGTSGRQAGRQVGHRLGWPDHLMHRNSVTRGGMSARMCVCVCKRE